MFGIGNGNVVQTGADGTVYVGSSTGLFALNPDGAQKWAFSTSDRVYSNHRVNSNGLIYVGSCDGNLYAVNPDGTQKVARFDQ